MEREKRGGGGGAQRSRSQHRGPEQSLGSLLVSATADIYFQTFGGHLLVWREDFFPGPVVGLFHLLWVCFGFVGVFLVGWLFFKVIHV